MQKEIIEECTIDHLEVEVQKCLRRLIEMENRVRRANRGGIQDSRYLLPKGRNMRKMTLQEEKEYLLLNVKTLQEEKEHLLLDVKQDRMALRDQRRGSMRVLNELDENIIKRSKFYFKDR